VRVGEMVGKTFLKRGEVTVPGSLQILYYYFVSTDTQYSFMRWELGISGIKQSFVLCILYH
jgi:hypothetical protein